MRKILFRGKRVDNGEWVEGSLVPITINCYDKGYEIIDADGIEYDELDYYNPLFCSDRVIPETIGQYTGLTDKNGVKIFEGDIVKAQDDIYGSPFCDGITGKIVYSETSFFIEPQNPMDSQYLFNECAVYEVIGNIYDNPELSEV